MGKNQTYVQVVDLEEAIESYTGYCTECRDFTTGNVEPDAQGYECEVCGKHTVTGAEEALIAGLINIAG